MSVSWIFFFIQVELDLVINSNPTHPSCNTMIMYRMLYYFNGIQIFKDEKKCVNNPKWRRNVLKTPSGWKLKDKVWNSLLSAVQNTKPKVAHQSNVQNSIRTTWEKAFFLLHKIGTISVQDSLYKNREKRQSFPKRRKLNDETEKRPQHISLMAFCPKFLIQNWEKVNSFSKVRELTPQGQSWEKI